MLLRSRGISEVVWICGGALLLIVTRLMQVRTALRAVREGLDVYLFLAGMMLLAELAATKVCSNGWPTWLHATHAA